MSFKYKYEHLHCGFCAEITDDGCPHLHCPHVLENIRDLLRDPEFIEAVDNADICESYHRPALLLVKEIMDVDFDYEDEPEAFFPPKEAFASFKAECGACPYPRHGYICYDETTGYCLKDAMDAIMRKDRPYGDGH